MEEVRLDKMDKMSDEIAFLQGDIKRLLKSVDDDNLPLSQKAYYVMKDLIITIKLKPGQMILEREMVAALDMSRTPIREALVRLELDGWIRIIPRRGFLVSAIKAEEFEPIFEVVEALDELAISLATSKATAQDFERLDSIIRNQAEALKENNLLAWVNLDLLFHDKIIDMANNQRLKRIREAEYEHLYRLDLYTIKNRTIPLESLLEHQAIVANMKIRKAEAARIVLRSHRTRVIGEIKDAIELSR